MRCVPHIAVALLTAAVGGCVDLRLPPPRDGGADGGFDSPVEMPAGDASEAGDAPGDVTGDTADGGWRDGDAGDARGDAGDAADAGMPNPSLVGYWKLDSIAGGMAIDSSAQGNNGMIKGIPTLTSPSSRISFTDPAAFAFATIDDSVEVPDRASLRPAQLSVSLWVKFSTPAGHDPCGNVPTGLQYLINRPTTNRNGGQFEAFALMRTQDGKIGFVIGDNASHRTEIDSTSLTVATNTWYHVVGTFDGTNLRLYVNGAVAATGTRTFPVDYDSNRPLFIGRSGQCRTRGLGDVDWDVSLNGALDDVRLYNRALSGLEVSSLAAGNAD